MGVNRPPEANNTQAVKPESFVSLKPKLNSTPVKNHSCSHVPFTFTTSDRHHAQSSSGHSFTHSVKRWFGLRCSRQPCANTGLAWKSSYVLRPNTTN